jgi:CheY-like chemotaxis protein/anti-sigma regulatory factor (Ser/Thr protein kinase)
MAPAACGELVDHINQCTASLNALLADLLDVSKLDAGVVTPTLTEFALDDMLTVLESVNSAEAELKGLRVRWRHSGLAVRTDRQLLQRILGNLIANAIRYTDRGGVLVACRRHAGVRWIEVWDTGIGIAAEDTGVIFEEFRQLGDNARNRGSGLGLAIAAKTSAVLGLRMRVRSTPGRGSMFAIELPACVEHAPESSAAPPPAERSLTIGLVEDNPEVRQALVLGLESAGHVVFATGTGAELIAHLGDVAPDLVISDLRLADAKTGFDVIEALRAIFGTDLPAILITGDTDPALIRSFAERGIAVYFKPVRLDELTAYVREATAKLPPKRRGPLTQA